MTEQQRQQIRAELARAMGWTINEMRLGHFCLIAPDGSYRDCFHSEPEDVWECERLPDPFTSAADKDALVKWLAQEDGRWYCFVHALDKLLDTQDERSKQYPNPPFDNGRGLFYQAVKSFILAPLETVTLAAARALGIQEAGE